MLRFLIQRLIAAGVTLWITTVAVTLLIHAVPGDPVRIMYAKFQSTPEQIEAIRTSRYIFGTLVASAFLATLAGILFAAKIGSGSLTAGPPYLLPAFAAVLLGTTQVNPGRANVGGTIVAIFLVATGSKGLQLMGVPIWVSSLFNGTVLIVAVALSQLRKAARAA